MNSDQSDLVLPWDGERKLNRLRALFATNGLAGKTRDRHTAERLGLDSSRYEPWWRHTSLKTEDGPGSES